MCWWPRDFLLINVVCLLCSKIFELDLKPSDETVHFYKVKCVEYSTGFIGYVRHVVLIENFYDSLKASCTFVKTSVVPWLWPSLGVTSTSLRHSVEIFAWNVCEINPLTDLPSYGFWNSDLYRQVTGSHSSHLCFCWFSTPIKLQLRWRISSYSSETKQLHYFVKCSRHCGRVCKSLSFVYSVFPF